jgi:hypothetical protein
METKTITFEVLEIVYQAAQHVRLATKDLLLPQASCSTTPTTLSRVQNAKKIIFPTPGIEPGPCRDS